MNQNRKAFLDMIAVSEIGKTLLAKSDNGYDVLVGGALFRGYADHPRTLVKLSATLSSTAAGRYQLLARYWDAYRKQLGLADFSPASQDAVALQQIKERRALDDVDAGRVAVAISKVSNIWASLPGAGYGQHENMMPELIAAYRSAGGAVVT